VFIAPATITLSASASDVDGQVVKVEFFYGTNTLALTNGPYQFTWSNVPAGVYNLFAAATDNLGSTNVSSLVTITNKTPGFVKLESPQGGGGSFSMLITGEAGQV
jgi:chitinase